MVELSPEALEAFLGSPDPSSFVMLNLIRFDPDGGRERYLRYHQMAKPALDRYGVEILFSGNGLPSLTVGTSSSWDAIVLVRYPNRTAFKTMVADPEYQRAFEVGSSAIAEMTLQPMTLMDEIHAA